MKQTKSFDSLYLVCCGEMIDVETGESVGEFSEWPVPWMDDYDRLDPTFSMDGLELFDAHSRQTIFTFFSVEALRSYEEKYYTWNYDGNEPSPGFYGFCALESSLIQGKEKCPTHNAFIKFMEVRNASRRRAITVAKNSRVARTNKATVRTRRGGNCKSRG